jgi:riboflavin transporter 2
MLANSPPHVDIYSTSTNRFHLKAIVYFLVMIFGLGTWTNLAGVWIELPIIVPILPESWQLPAKLTLIISSANIFPILIVFASLIFKLNTAPFEVPVNFILLLISITFAFAFAFLWNRTAYLFGTEQSVCLMFLCFFTAIADCMSSTTFIPFLHRYEPIYLNAYFSGEALTALLPALLGMGQSIGKSDCVLIGNQTDGTLIEVHHPPRFSVRTYFLLLSLLPLAALLAFSILRFMKTGRLKTKTSMKEFKHHQSRIFILMDNIEDMNFIQNTIKTINKIENQLKHEKTKNHFKKFIMSESGIFLFIVFQCSAMLYGACQGLTTFSLNAYSATTFHYTIIASKIKTIIKKKKKNLIQFLFPSGQFAYPIMTLIGAFISEVSSKILYLLHVISIGLFIYIFLTVSECIDDIENILCIFF